MDHMTIVCYAIAWHTMEGCHKRCYGRPKCNDPMAKVPGKTDSGRTYSQDRPGMIQQGGIKDARMGVVINRIRRVVVAAPAPDTAVFRRLGKE
jgi:hypothetical protein